MLVTHSIRAVAAAAAASLLLGALGARGGEATDRVKWTTDRIIAIVSDPALKGNAQADTRRQRIRAEIDQRFDWDAMGAQAIAGHWDGCTAEERAEFLAAFSTLLERTYLGKIEGYAGEVVSYTAETARPDGTVGVKVRITTTKQTEIPVEYVLRKTDDDWRAVDVVIENVSLVQNYRTQFASILKRDSFPGLMKILRKKVGTKEAGK